MGYGKKTDFATGRTLDLDKSYKFLIKPAVKSCGVECIRADEIRHAGVIDVPMYEKLLDADVVVADLSTANPNAFYELGVRHALRPRTTVVIAESKMVYPFDVNHTVIRTYQHLGDVIDIEEAQRFTEELSEAIKAVLAQPRTDSPVYTFLPNLQPPQAGAAAAVMVRGAGEGVRVRSITPAEPAPAPGAIPEPAPGAPIVGQLLAQAEAAIGRSDFITAKALFGELRRMKPADQPWTANDTSLVQRLALATYKSKLPTPEKALEEAVELLGQLTPDTSNDTETLGLWGSVHKRLWDLRSKADIDAARPHLDGAVQAYERGYSLRNDYYNGINYAYLLNVRASVSEPAEAIADFVLARRVRQQIVRLCEPMVGTILDRDANAPERESDYWVLATLAEAYVGLGRDEEAARLLEQAKGLPGVKGWMLDSTNEQLASLRALLVDPPLKHIAR
jgi:tetratricopeptide (TPR) repeat protein